MFLKGRYVYFMNTPPPSTGETRNVVQYCSGGRDTGPDVRAGGGEGGEGGECASQARKIVTFHTAVYHGEHRIHEKAPSESDFNSWYFQSFC